ncbi:MAG: hypothetical protein HUJ66_07335 [Oscillospiraceae bacterium]|nr:hypothetical protein [Oscillospiraceae bacterium]
MNINFPTSCDIYLEADGRKIAAVQSYRAVSKKTERLIEAFGSSEPVAVLTTGLSHVLELSRLYATQEAVSDGLSFHELTDFNLVIVKPDRRIVYTGCRWSGIEEEGRLGETVAEKVRILAARRTELAP